MPASSLSASSTTDIERCSLFRIEMASSIPLLRSDDFRVSRARLALAQVAVEHHAHRAHQQTPLGRDHDPVGAELHQAVALEALQIGELGGEVLAEIDQVGKLDRL